ncbi:MAG: glutamate--tRNA ligase [Verrucomicrobia bacterium]|nr:glutamate--tRNA ligase [Verrucomicrobiota bacterium]MBV8485985.1 glutamate--tRNA ligase [Verrucomicrobiota bacterium]
MSTPVRVRFAPSPTGFLHVGGARTALFNWLFARHNQGVFVLRIEDTDKSREREDAVAVIYEGLRWLGVEWDEGGDKGGKFGPYFQSERGAIYEKYLKTLDKKGQVYEDQGAIRFRAPRRPVVVDDIVCGRIEFDRSMEPDMTIRRPDGSWIFHFVNVVDDIEMKISHVIRGEDHLTNTSKHIALYQALEIEPPRFAHIPLILNRDGSKMSKRDEGSSLATYIEQGYAPEAVRNYLCLLGWSPKDNREKLDIAETIQLFDLEKVNRRNASFDLDKCNWLNYQYLAQMPVPRFRELSLPFIEKAGIQVTDEAYLTEVLKLVQEKIKLLKDVPDWIGYFFTEDYDYDPEAVAKTFAGAGVMSRLGKLRETYQSMAEWNAEALENALKTLAKSIPCKTGELIHPARLAVSGRSFGPSLYHMLEVLGRERVLTRLERTIEKFTK